MTRNHLVIALAVVLGACSKGSSADVDTFMKLDTEKAAAFAAGGKDCAAKARSVGEWRTKHSARYEALQAQLYAKWPKGPPKEVEEEYGEAMDRNRKAVLEATWHCSNDVTFGKMIDDTSHD